MFYTDGKLARRRRSRQSSPNCFPMPRVHMHQMPDWWASLAALPGVRLRCRLRVATRRPLPNAGEIRGAVGRSLIASGNGETLACLFPSTREEEPQAAFGHATPWALHITDDGILEIGLFADAPSHLVVLIKALMDAGESRIGQHDGLRFEGFEHQMALVDGDWHAGMPSQLGRWAPGPNPPGPCESMLLSPLRIRIRGKDLGPANLAPRDVLAQLMRRVTGLLQQAAMPVPPWDARRLLVAVGGCPFERRDLRVVSINRFSSRQGQAMRLQGLIGCVRWPQDMVKTFWPLLWMGQALHVGKTPCLGMGRYRLQAAKAN